MNVYEAAAKPIRLKSQTGEYVTGALDYYREAGDDWRGHYFPPRAHIIKAVSEFVERGQQVVLAVFIDDLVHFTPEIGQEIEASLTSGGAIDPRLNKNFFVYVDEDEQPLRDFNQRRRDRYTEDVINSGAGDGKTDFDTPPPQKFPFNDGQAGPPEKTKAERKAEKRGEK